MRAARWFCVLCLAVGCSRAHYREQADYESYGAIDERNHCPAWQLPRIDITPAPGSRLADVYSIDRPPMPPDDPAAHSYMHCVDGMRGWKHWHDNGDIPSVEPPGWRDSLPVDPDGVITLSPDRAVAIALDNSREYQTALEQVYLTALSLTLNRFEFDCRWFLRNTTTLTQFGSSATEANSVSTLTNFGFERNFPAGGQLLVDLANSVVVTFRGGQTSVASNILLQFFQPFLRGGGRDVRLEGLTQAERDLLHAIRDFARFRKNFYADLTTRGNSFLGLLLQLQNIRNFEANVASQEQTLRLHEALLAGGIVSTVQLDQVFQSYQQARFALLQAQTSFENDLDSYKLSLGLPPEIRVKLDDAQLQPFQLAPPELTRDQTAVDTLLAEFRERDAAPTVDELRNGFERLRGYTVRGLAFASDLDLELSRWKTRLADPKSSIDPENRDRERALYEALVRQRQVTLEGLHALQTQVDQAGQALAERNRTNAWRQLLRLTRLLIARLGELFVVETQVRVFLIDLPNVDYDEAAAVQYALCNRLDLMNIRARVVDSWRKITVAANGLEADLNLILTARPTTEPGSLNPFDFSSQASLYSMAVQFDGPLNRVAARNIYRASLIDYQRSRRLLMRAEDDVRRAIRRNLRQLRNDRLGFSIARLTLLAAARQLDGARQSLLLTERGTDSTTSTLNILNALSGLLQARNALIGQYVSYETNRLQLLLDLEALQLDDRGLPIHETTALDAIAERGIAPRLADIADLLPAPAAAPPKQ